MKSLVQEVYVAKHRAEGMEQLNPLSLLLLLTLLLSSCQNKPTTNNTLFTSLNPKQTNISFNNQLTFTEEYNPYTFKNFLNGGGVALGDINNDQLVDIYFTGNLVGNKLYLNQGNFKFKDISESAGVACEDVWSTGSAFVDINHDGLLDLYVCKSGKPEAPNRHNQLFVNNGDGTFTDKAKEYGLDFLGLSIHSAFFDYDKDGDLDCYLLNNSIRSVGAYDIIENLRDRPDPKGGNKLLKNMEVETGSLRFEDVSETAGIYTSEIGFGLGVSIADLNGDNWDDIFVSNDFFERDYLYINQQDGTFKENITSSMSELSMGSMGADIADINNDQLPDIFVTEMLPEKLDRYKSKTVFESYNKSVLNRSKGYHNQFGRNVLQYNRGNENEIPQFVELGRYHGVEATDWSWGALMTDFDNNGWKDIFVANGIAKDLLDQDHINFYNPQRIGDMVRSNRKDVVSTIINDFPKEKLDNYLYLQKSSDQFQKIDFSNIDTPNFSNGSAYADLDNDGDLDLVLNTIDEPARIYRNNTSGQSYLQIKLTGKDKNTKAIGSKVTVFANQQSYYLDLNPMRGYQSCVDYQLHFGLGTAKQIDSLQIIWPDQSESHHYQLSVDSAYQFDIKYAKPKPALNTTAKSNNTTLLKRTKNILDYKHQENRFSDFDQNRMLLTMISNEGPKVTVADINNDGQDELLITGSSGQASVCFEWNGKSMQQKEIAAFEQNKKSETSNFIINDFDGNGSADIFMLNGGSEARKATSALRDQLLLNTANNFTLDQKSINTGFTTSAAGLALDVDNDKDQDILVGARMQTQAYGVPADLHLLTNENGVYKKEVEANKKLKGIGMIKDMLLADFDQDGKEEILVARECDGLLLLKNNNGLQIQSTKGLDEVKGLWNDITVADIDKDNDLDIIACNLGLNQRYKNLSDGSLFLFVNDFDANGTVDLIYCVEENGNYYPIHLKDELLKQLPSLKKKILKYSDYAKSSMKDLFKPEILSQSIIHEVNEYRSGIFINNQETFNFVALPDEVQYSEQKAVWSGDLNSDGWPDLVLGGNQYEVKPEIGMNAASYGHVLINQKDGSFRPLPHEESGFFERGQIRDIKDISIGNEKYLIVLKNNAAASVYRIGE